MKYAPINQPSPDLQRRLEDNLTVHTALDSIKELHAWCKGQAEVKEEGQHVAADVATTTTRLLGCGPLPPQAACCPPRACAQRMMGQGAAAKAQGLVLSCVGVRVTKKKVAEGQSGWTQYRGRADYCWTDPLLL